MNNFLSILKLIFLTGLFLFSSANAQNFWRRTNGPPGGTYGIAFTSNGDAFLTTSKREVLLSTDSGETWIETGKIPQNCYLYKIGINSKDDIFVGGYAGGIWRSTNHGESWEHLFLPYIGFTVGALAFNSRDDVFISIVDDGPFGLYRSEDNGDSWEKLNYPEHCSVEDLFVAENGDIFTAGYKGILVSYDDGNSWTNILPYGNFYSIFFTNTGTILAGGSLIFRSADYGNSWDYFNINGTPLSFAITKNNDLFAGLINGGVYKSTDDGISWEQVDSEILGFDIWDVKVNRKQIIFASSSDRGLCISLDNGKTWEQKGAPSSFVHQLQIGSNNHIYAKANSFFYESSDNGSAWRLIYPASVKSFALTENGNIFLIDYDNNRNIFKSDNDGNSWEVVYSANTSEFAGIFSNGINIYAANGSKVLKSTNNGTDWEYLEGNFSQIKVIYEDSRQYVFVGTDSGLYKYDLNNDEWNLIDDGLPHTKIIQIDSYFNDSEYILNANGVPYFSSDFGDSWIKRSNGIPNDGSGANFVSFADAGLLYAAACENKGYWSEGGLYYSSDKGENWFLYDNSGLSTTAAVNFAIDSDDNIYLGTFGYGVYQSNGPVTSVQEPEEKITEFVLKQNYPNPFSKESGGNPSTTIEYSVRAKSQNPGKSGHVFESQMVTLKVFNVLGQEVATLVNEEKNPGNYKTVWNASNLPSGLYFAELTSGEYRKTIKMLLLK